MNLPNLITLSRIPMMFVIVGLMYCVFPGAATLAFVCFVLSAIGDWADGYLARKRGLISTFGKFMDALTDKVLVLGIMIALVQLDVVQIIWVLVIIVREFLISGMRMMAASKGVVVAAERGGKLKTLIQLISLGVLLFVPVLRHDVVRISSLDFGSFATQLNRIGVGLFILGSVLTVTSGTSYALKYRKVWEEVTG
jgi:CDP-diacylglycerol--glycerol-3-phosphate 3-phosphatidyltransferase